MIKSNASVHILHAIYMLQFPGSTSKETAVTSVICDTGKKEAKFSTTYLGDSRDAESYANTVVRGLSSIDKYSCPPFG
jgi:hypothetical protein